MVVYSGLRSIPNCAGDFRSLRFRDAVPAFSGMVGCRPRQVNEWGACRILLILAEAIQPKHLLIYALSITTASALVSQDYNIIGIAVWFDYWGVRRVYPPNFQSRYHEHGYETGTRNHSKYGYWLGVGVSFAQVLRERKTSHCQRLHQIPSYLHWRCSSDFHLSTSRVV